MLAKECKGGCGKKIWPKSTYCMVCWQIGERSPKYGKIGSRYAKIKIKCARCQNTFLRPPCRSKGNRYCSISCSNKHKEILYKNKRNLGEKNGQWKGADVGYKAIHNWVRRHKTYSIYCENCGVYNGSRNHDLANISQEYKRDINDWEWLCRRCHMTKDGRMEKLIERQKARKILRKPCLSCGKIKKKIQGTRCGQCGVTTPRNRKKKIL